MDNPNSEAVAESLVDLVIGNPLIREIILCHCMFSKKKMFPKDNDNTLNRTELKTLRLVCKTWLLETNFILYKEIAIHPCSLFEDRAFHNFVLYENSDAVSIERDGFKVLPKALAQDLLNNPHRVDSRRFPPIKLDLHYIKLVSSQLTLDFLKEYASWIVNLTLWDIENDEEGEDDDEDEDPDFRTFPEYPDLPLDNLKTLNFNNVWYGLPQLQKLLRGASTLRSFKMGLIKPSSWKDDLHGNPDRSIADLALPRSLLELMVRFDSIVIEEAIMTAANDVVNLMTRNSLPNLKILELSIGTGPRVTSQHLVRILTPVASSLENLVLSGYRERTEANLKIGLPIKGLKSLKRLTVGTPMPAMCANWDLEEKYATSQLGEYFPNLRNISLYLMASQVDMWIGRGAVFPRVKHAEIFAHEYEKVEAGQHAYQYYPNLSPDKVRAIQRTFPNLVRLSVRLAIPDVEGLWYVFSQMKNLEFLQIIIAVLVVTPDGRRRGTDELRSLQEAFSVDAFLLGISTEEVEQAWEDYKRGISRQMPTFPNVCYLKKLKSLTLSCSWLHEWTRLNEMSKVSDAAFDLAFLQMGMLKNLEIHDKFAKVSEEKLNEWKCLKGTAVVMNPCMV